MAPKGWRDEKMEAYFRSLNNDPSALEYVGGGRFNRLDRTPPIPPQAISPNLAQSLSSGFNPAINAPESQGISPAKSQKLVTAINPTVGVGGGAGWPDPFMSYTPQYTPIIWNGVNGGVIEYLSFEGFERPNPRPIYLYNCSNITIRRIDTRKCTMGLVYAEDCTNITVEYCRAENIGYEFVYDAFPGNDNDLNFYQFNNVNGFYVHHLKGKFGNTEDVLSHFASSNGEVHDVYWEGGINNGHTTSDGSPSCYWRSDSGTGAICGDADGANVWIHDCTFLNPGQVGLAIAGGTDCTFDNCVVYQEASGQPINTAAYVWNQYTTCSGHAMTNCDGYFNGGGGFWDGGNCGYIDLTGSDFENSGLSASALRVTL